MSLKLRELKSVLKKVLMEKYGYPEPSASILADKIYRFMAKMIAEGADFGTSGGDNNSILRIIALYFEQNPNNRR